MKRSIILPVIFSLGLFCSSQKSETVDLNSLKKPVITFFAIITLGGIVLEKNKKNFIKDNSSEESKKNDLANCIVAFLILGAATYAAKYVHSVKK